MLSNRSLLRLLLFLIGGLLVILLLHYTGFSTWNIQFNNHKRSGAKSFPERTSPQNISNPLLRVKEVRQTESGENISSELKSAGTDENSDGVFRIGDEQDDSSVYPTTSSNFSMYGDGSCPHHKYRKIYAKLFEKWMEIAKAEELEYFLACGTLLGSMRNGNLIPYDGDMDILISREDFHKVSKHDSNRTFVGTESQVFVYVHRDFHLPYEQRRRFSCKGKKVPAYMDHCSFQEPLGRIITENCHIDIYDYRREGKKLLDFSDGSREYDESDIFPLRRCYLMGYKTTCPNDPVSVLKKYYGKDLTPSRICKNGAWVDKED